MARILTGIQSSGRPHLGNILGAISPMISLSNSTNSPVFAFIADLHSLTTLYDRKQRIDNTLLVAAAWIACGLDVKKHFLYRQSRVPEVCELSWYFSCFASFSRLSNAHSFKDKADRLDTVHAGLFTYPILMAADILIFNADIVPVGKDQKQHIEIAREIAHSFNSKYGEIFNMPEPLIDEGRMVVPGTDGNKMSKSYNNIIDVFADEPALKKAVMSIKTDSKSISESKDIHTCVIYKLHDLIAPVESTKILAEKYSSGTIGYGDAKKQLLHAILDKYSNERAHFQKMISDPKQIEEILCGRETIAREYAVDSIKNVRKCLGY